MHFIFSPEVVLCKRYGTCSAKATLTFALLQFVRLYGEDASLSAKLRGRRSEVAKMRRRSAKLQRRKCESEHQHRKCQHLTQYISIYKLFIHFCDSMNIFSTFDLHDSKFACNCYDVFRMKETPELAEIINFFLASNVSCIRHCSVFPE